VSVKSILSLNIKSHHLSKPKTTGARNPNSITWQKLRKKLEKPDSQETWSALA